MPQSLGRGGISPFELAKAYRDLHPGKFDDLDDNELVQSIREVDPDSYALIDPLLEGADVLAPTTGGRVPRLGTFVDPTPPPAPRLVPPPPQVGMVVPTALRAVPAVAGTLIGSAVAPGLGTVAGGALGGGLGETLAQAYEKTFGEREAYNPYAIGAEAALNTIPGSKGATVGRRILETGAQGAFAGGTSETVRSITERGRLPTAAEFLPATALGGMFGATVGAGVEGAGHVAGQLRSAANTDFGLPPAAPLTPRAPGPMGSYVAGLRVPAPTTPDPSAMPMLDAAARTQVHQEFNQAMRRAVTTESGRAIPELNRMVEARDYLSRLAELDQVPVPIPPIQPGLTPPVAPRQLPPGRGDLVVQGFPSEQAAELAPPAPPGIAYSAPSPEAPAAVGSVGAVSQALESSLQAPPAGPQLVLRPHADVPRGTAAPEQLGLLRPPKLRMDTPIRSPQFAELGGAPPDPSQPRLPGVTQPRPIDRVYTTGPNAGPRREGELHGAPRTLRRQVQSGKKLSYETVPTKLHAEDPGTYPPEVRRELARMAWELETYPHERHAGGLQPGQLEAFLEAHPDMDVASAIGELRRRGATAGGATPGAPVYHEIRAAAKDSYPSNVKRAEMLRQIRAALLEGRGTGLTDAAAQVARGRLAQEAAGGRGIIGKRFNGERFSHGHSVQSNPGAGDDLIGWRDPDTGEPTTSLAEMDEIDRAIREASDGEILAAARAHATLADLSPEAEDFFKAARVEAERRGLIDAEQLPLTMEAPGGAKGPSLFDFEGGPPQKPAAAEPTLPGLEGVRDESRAMPPVADAPFSLTAPNHPGIPQRQGSLLDRLKGEEGVLILNIPKGDRAGLKRWMKQHEDAHGGEAWYSRVEQAMEDGDWDRAWKAAAGASLKSYSRARERAATPQQEALLDQALRGTPFQSDINAQIVARGRQSRQGLPVVKGSGEEFPPAPTLSAAAGERGRATVGPAGILNPGPPKKPLEPKYTDHLLSRGLQQSILEETDPDLLTLVPGNRDTNLRLYRQVADLAFQGINSKDVKQYLKLSDQEIAQHYLRSVQEAARTLQQLSAFRQVNKATLDQLAHQMSMGGALRGILGGEAPTITGRRGRVIGRAGAIQPERTLEVLAEEGRSFDALMLQNALQKPKSASEWDLIHGASYPFMVSKVATAVRNAVTGMGRYGLEALDEAFRIPLERLMGTPKGLAEAQGLTRERLAGATKTSAYVPPTRSWKEGIQDLYNITASTLQGMSPEDARQTLKLLKEFPSEEANFLGWSGGEELEGGKSRFALVNSLIDPKVQRLITVFNRSQEFTGRGMVFDATMRGQLRARGLDPNEVLQRPPAQIAEAVGGAQALDELMHNSVAAALEATFASRAAKDSVPGALLRFINQAGFLKLGYPFPKFNLVAAPRFLWDHGPWATMDLLRFPLDAIGLTSGTSGGSRLFRGVRAQRLESQAIPELVGKRQAAENRLGLSVRELLTTRRELAVRQRQLTRMEARTGQDLPGVETLDAVRQQVDQLQRRRQVSQAAVGEHKSTIRDLQSQEERLMDLVRDAHGINAPNLPQYFARVSTGMAMLGAAFAVRNSEGAKGTRWYEYRVDREGKDPLILDVRPFAPFAQYLFVADVLQDFHANTNWDKATAQVEAEGGHVKGGLDWTKAVWDNYQGKYTEGELGAQFAQAFLSISRAAGTTLTITDLLTQNGWPSLQDASDAIIGTMGQFLSRFTVPAQQLSDIAALVSPEEAKARIPPRATLEEPFRPLAAPLANIPGVRQLIPERISQTTGKPVATETPSLRLAGIGTTPRDFITEEVRRIGVPGPSVYIRETGDYGLDRLVAETYARILQQELPPVLESPEYQQLGTPAQQRDYMQRFIFPALKRAAMGEVRESLGESRYQGATVRGESARRKSRQLELVDSLDREAGTVPATEEPTDPSAPPPPPPPAPF